MFDKAAEARLFCWRSFFGRPMTNGKCTAEFTQSLLENTPTRKNGEGWPQELDLKQSLLQFTTSITTSATPWPKSAPPSTISWSWPSNTRLTSSVEMPTRQASVTTTAKLFKTHGIPQSVCSFVAMLLHTTKARSHTDRLVSRSTTTPSQMILLHFRTWTACGFTFSHGEKQQYNKPLERLFRQRA